MTESQELGLSNQMARNRKGTTEDERDALRFHTVTNEKDAVPHCYFWWSFNLGEVAKGGFSGVQQHLPKA